MSETELPQGEVRLEFPFEGCSFGFVLFSHPVGTFELCMVDAESKQIFLNLGLFATLDEVQEEYKQFIDTFAAAMRKIEWND